MFSFFSSPAYTEINITIDKQNIDEQLAHIRMEDIRTYHPYFILPNMTNTKNILIFISNALETPAIQKNIDYLDTLETYLIKINENIAYYESTKSNGLYKWLFWSAPSADLKSLRDQTNAYIEQVLTFRENAPQNEMPYYQQSDSKRIS